MTTQEFEDYLKSIGGLESSYREGITITSLPVKDGWLGLIKELIEKLIAAGWDKQVSQVKEKFGGLRFYIGEGSDEIYKIIHEYEAKSYHICETCGEPSNLRKRPGGWLFTSCDNHSEGLEEFNYKK